MATPVITHRTVTGAAANPDVLVDGPSWDDSHVVTGLENVPNVDTSNADHITAGSQTGTGAMVRATSPALVTPNLGTPSAAVLTNATGLPLATGVSGLGTGVATFLGTPSSANLKAALTDETGSGAAVFATSPTLVTPALGTPSSGTLTSCTGLPVSTGVSGLGTGVATFLATPSSANLAAAVTGATGSGAVVFATSPTLVTPALGTPASGNLANCTGYVNTSFSSVLGADVALNNTASYFDGPSVAQGSTGTWFVVGHVTVLDTAGAATFSAKITDGTTIVASSRGVSTGASNSVSVALQGIITNPTGNLKIMAVDHTSTSGAIKFNLTGNGKDTVITAIRIA